MHGCLALAGNKFKKTDQALNKDRTGIRSSSYLISVNLHSVKEPVCFTACRNVTDFESDGFRDFHESDGFADPFANGFGFDFRFEFEKDQLLSADSLTLIIKTKRVCKVYNIVVFRRNKSAAK